MQSRSNKQIPISPITTISVKELLAEFVFMLDTDANLIKIRSLHPDTQILKEDKLHVTDITDVKLHVDVTDGFIESVPFTHGAPA